VDAAPTAGRIVNLSVRARLSAVAPMLTVGFVVEGAALPVLVRGVGPGLSALGVGTPLADPQLTLFTQGNIRAANDDWASASGVADTGSRVGAFPLGAGSRDAALVVSLDGGSFTARCAPAVAADGVALVEVYDAGVASTGRLVNVSARTLVGTGEDVMIAGFSVQGNLPRLVVIRGIGPGLRQFGVTNVLSDPEIRLLRAGSPVPVATNDNWGGSAELAAAFLGVGAFALVADSRDAALVASLDPGSYTVVVAGVGGGTGEGLVEIYEMER
jgi:hypothetical protein